MQENIVLEKRHWGDLNENYAFFHRNPEKQPPFTGN